MTSRTDERPGWLYYGAIALFVGILAFAVLGLVRSSSAVGAAASPRLTREPQPTKPPAPGSILAAGPPPTIEIPPSTASVATPPPSRTYIHPPPEEGAVYPEPATDLRR